MLRIDHFRGFAAHWRIPVHEATALKGEWVLGPGAALFEAFADKLGPLPIIAEDLGIITPDVVSLRRRFDLPGMAVLQFAFGGDSGNLYLPHNHHSDLVVYTGTHDNNTTLGWWQSLEESERQQVGDYMGTRSAEIHWDLIRLACSSVADTAIYPLQDVLGLDAVHRMNVPGHGDHCWRWRFNWAQFGAPPAERLAALCRLYRRDGTPLNY
jgi:4-alpha-glucanotransferase